MYYKCIYIFALLLIIHACNSKQQQEKEKIDVSSLKFELPAVPMIITDPLERADYLVSHYWDNFNFSNKGYLDRPEVMEQALVDYINLMNHASPEIVRTSIKHMMTQAETDSAMHADFFALYERYLFDPNSPFRNEELFIPVLESMLTSSVTDDVQKIRPQHLLTIALRNRVGEPAADFSYTTPDGKKGSIYKLKSDYLLIYFYNPDCDACKETAQQIHASSSVIQLIKANRLKILAVYPDEDLETWKAHLSFYPFGWIQSYDEGMQLKDQEIYDLKAIPTIYLLDKDKKVLLKDPTFRQLENYLSIITK